MKSGKRVVVTGDVLIEWRFAESRILHRTGALWDTGYYVQCYPEGSSATMTGELIAKAARREPPLAGSVRYPGTSHLPKTPGAPPFWHAYMLCAQFPTRKVKAGKPKPDDDAPVWRIKQRIGTDRQSVLDLPKLLDDEADDGNADLVVVEEAYKGFGECRSAWPRSLCEPQNNQAWALVRWVRPNFGKSMDSKLWRHLGTKFADRIAVVVTIDDLRITPMRLSRALTWERVIEDLDGELRAVWSQQLAACRHLVVSFFGAGAAVFTRTASDDYEGHLYFDPTRTPETWRDDYPGYMVGYTRCMTAAVALQLLRAMDSSGPNPLGPAVVPGLLAQCELQRRGFRARGSFTALGEYGDTALPKQLAFPTRRLAKLIRAELDTGSAGGAYVHREIPRHLDNNPAETDRDKWKILRDELSGAPKIFMQAKRIVELGIDSQKWQFPVARFGKLFATDRTEIESYRAIGALMTNYMAVPKRAVPLSIGVFGSPGSGKSFGIEAVAEHVAMAQPVEALTFNLSQLSSPDAIIHALHQVRDIGLSGAMPLVFWDEFDTALVDKDLGWLRYFLAPMQDGKFQEGPITHNIGRAIFVFAGGTHRKMSEFEATAATTEAKRTKASDFVSRLKGYVDVPGLDYPDRDTVEPSIALRRAVLLNSFLKQSAGNLTQTIALPGKKLIERINIDTGLTYAFLRIQKYNYAARSMEAIIKMSAISGSSMFERSSLAPSEQMRLHVDARRFLELIAEAPAWMDADDD